MKGRQEGDTHRAPRNSGPSGGLCFAQERYGKILVVARAALSAMAVLSISGLVEIYGLYDKIYFNKGVISAAVFLLSMAVSRRTAEDFRKDRRTFAVSFSLSVLLIFTEILGTGLRLLVNGSPVRLSAPSVLWMAVSAAALACLAEPFFFWLILAGRDRGGEHRAGKDLNRIFLTAWLAVFLGYIPCFLAFYPGLYCYDMIWQWQMFATGDYSTHHPLLHTALSGGLLELGKRVFGSYNAGLAIYAVVQLLILSGSIAFAIWYMVKAGIPGRVWKIAAAFYILFPFFPVSGISTTKDIIFGSLFLVVFVCICDMTAGRAVYRGWRLALFLTAAIFMGVFRNNAVLGLCVTVACLLAAYGILRLRGEKNRLVLQMALVLLTAIVGIEGMFVVTEKAFRAEKGSAAEMLSVPCQQLARTYVFHKDEMDPEDKEELFRYIPEEAMERYKYYVSDPVKSRLNMDYLEEHGREFFNLWLRIGKEFPGEYVLAPLYNTMGVWNLGGDSSCYVEYEMSPPFDGLHRVETRSLFPALRTGYRWFTDENIQRSLPLVSILFYTSFYCWMVLICMAVIIGRRRYLYLVLPAVLLGYIVTLLPGPCITVRYLLGVMLCVPVLTAVTFFGMEKGEEKRPKRRENLR